MSHTLKREMPREQQFPSHLLAASLVVMTLWLWKMLHDTSCLALTMPSALGMATTYGLLQYHLQRRRWLLSCYLTDRSGLERLPWRPWLTTARCLLTALPLTVVLAVFVAFADQAEWYMLLATGVLVPVLAVAARAWPGSHFRDHSTDVGPAAAPRNILTTRIAGSTCLAVGLTGCVYYGYHSPVPHELSPWRTVAMLHPVLVGPDEVRPAVYRVVWLLWTAASGRLRRARPLS